MIERQFDIAVVGAGIIGVTTAYYLLEAGLSVVVFDKHEDVAAETSYANGGFLTPSMSEPWAAPGMPLQMLKWIGRDDAPFLLRPKALPGMLLWGSAFFRNCTDVRWRHNMGQVFALAKESQRALEALLTRENIEFPYLRRGGLQLFQSKNDLDKAGKAASALEGFGIRVMQLSREECLQLEPQLNQSANSLEGGLYYPDDGSGDCRIFTEKLADICHARGAVFHMETDVTALSDAGEIKTTKGTFSVQNSVLATGFPPKGLLSVRERLRLLAYPVKGYTATVKPENTDTLPTVPLIDNTRKIGLIRIGDTLRLAGTAEFTGFDRRVRPERIANLIEALKALLPDIGPFDIVHEWAGLRPMSPTGMPFIGKVRDGLYASLSHGHLGWTNAAGAAVRLRKLIVGQGKSV